MMNPNEIMGATAWRTNPSIMLYSETEAIDKGVYANIVFHNGGYNCSTLYFHTDNNLYLHNYNGNYKIEMTKV